MTWLVHRSAEVDDSPQSHGFRTGPQLHRSDSPLTLSDKWSATNSGYIQVMA
jgi:hypothetical protein